MQSEQSLKTKPFSLRSRANSFRYAWEGICRFFAEEHNAWLHLSATIGVSVLACLLGVTRTEMILLIIVTGFVWVAEIFNTAIEKAMDLVDTGYNPRIKLIKDLAAAAVLVAAMISLLTGAVIFIPKII